MGLIILILILLSVAITLIMYKYFKKNFFISTAIGFFSAILVFVLFCGLFFLGIIGPTTQTPYFVIKNSSSDTIVLEFYKDMRSIGIYNENDSANNYCFKRGYQIECIDYASFVFGELAEYKHVNLINNLPSKLPIGYKNKKDFFNLYIKDSVRIRELFFDISYEICKSSKFNHLMILMNNADSHPLLKYTPNEYYKGDTVKFEKLLHSIIPIFLPSGYMFIKSVQPSGNDNVPIESSFAKASKIIIFGKGKWLYSIDKENFKKIMQRTEFNKEQESYVLEITDNDIKTIK